MSQRGARIRNACAILSVLLLLAACDGLWPAVPAPPETSTPTPVPANPAPPAETQESADDQLVVWLPQFLGVGQDTRAGDLLGALFHQYEQANPGVRLDVQIKAEQGAAGMSNYLRTAQQVAPSILPDVVLIETQQLWQLVDLGLVPPLDSDPMEREDFYSFAPASVAYQDAIYGLPYLADIVHVAYLLDRLEMPPATWADLLASGQTYAYPASGGDAFQNAPVLLQYVGAGGQLLADGSVSDPDALEAVFEFLVEARVRNVVSVEMTEVGGYSATWDLLVSQDATMADVSSEEFMLHQGSQPATGFGSTPTRDGAPATIARVWAFAVLTADEDRRKLSLALIERLFAPDAQGPLSEANRHLPSRRDALLAWTKDDAYIDFLDSRLDAAVALPNGRAFADFVRRLQAAQLAVLNGDLSPQEALLRVRSVE